MNLSPLYRKSLWPRWLKWLGGAVGIYGLALAALMIGEEYLIFVPSRYPLGNWSPAFEFEDAWFRANDGVQLHGWFLPRPQSRQVLLFAHGNGGNVADWAGEADALRRLAESAVLVFDYRGYGRSEGRPHEAGILADARAARVWLAQKTGVAETEIVLVGRSLGTGVMTHLAAHDGAKALVLHSPYTSLPDVAAVHYPWMPTRWVMRTRLDSQSTINRYHGPTFILHGDADALIPPALGRQLFQAAHEPKQFVTLRGCRHNDPIDSAGGAALGQFFRALP